MGVKKLNETVDIWKVTERGLTSTFEVHHSNGEILKVDWVTYGIRNGISKFHLRAILKIIEIGKYRI